jgi:hypothetical protein
MANYPRDLTSAIIEFEEGEMPKEQVVELFQYLIDSGLAWSLQGSYGRMARTLIDAGLCEPANRRKEAS